MTVDRATFLDQFRMFTCSMFEGWDESLWSNVLVAGGAVLASLLPLPPGYDKAVPIGHNVEYDLYYGRKRRSGTSALRTREQYFSETLCPTANVDLFVYGLDETQAQAKLMAILAQLRF
jgi:hypothetical protein